MSQLLIGNYRKIKAFKIFPKITFKLMVRQSDK